MQTRLQGGVACISGMWLPPLRNTKGRYAFNIYLVVLFYLFIYLSAPDHYIINISSMYYSSSSSSSNKIDKILLYTNAARTQMVNTNTCLYTCIFYLYVRIIYRVRFPTDGGSYHPTSVFKVPWRIFGNKYITLWRIVKQT